MLVVVCIIALMVTITMPSITAGIDSVRLHTATTSVASFLNAAVTRAERRQEAVEVVISPGDNRITMYSSEPGFERELDMPKGVSILGDAGATLLLLPGASTPGIGIQLGNQRGARRTVRLDPMTGFPRVEGAEN